MTIAGDAARAVAPTSVRDAWSSYSADRVAPLVLGAIVLCVAMLTITPWPVGVFQDDAIYVVLAKALASGEGFRMINMPGAPHGTHFPPGYPLVLAALWKVFPSFPDNIVVFKFLNAAFLAGAAAGTYRFGRSRLGLESLGAAIAALLGTISVVVLMITGVVLSEPLYMLLVIPTLLLAEHAAEDGSPRTAAGAGAMIGVLALVRTVGTFLVPAALLVLLVRRRWRSAAILLASALVFIVPWQLWISAYQGEMPGPFVGKYGAYGPWLAEGYKTGGLPFAWAVLGKNANELFGFLGYITLPVAAVWPRLVSLGTVIGLAAVGAASVWRRIPITLVFLLGYAAIILTWPFEPTRFALVWWPVLAGLCAAGVRRVWRWRPDPLALQLTRFAALAATLVVAVGYTTYNARGARQKWWANLQSDAAVSAKPIAEWVARSTKPDDVVISDHDLIVYLYTGRRAVPTATFTARGRITPLTAAQNADILRGMVTQLAPRWYIAVSQQSIDAAAILAAQQPPLLRYAGSIATARVYEPATK
ncbi:MAG: glycosyltransferase family 39 protein [Gemmatimonadetes bacterium]|nr:glycosyltransferase family 39 protein [Gemmatimonadota bacterium]